MTLFDTEPKLTNHEFKIKGAKLWTLTQEYYDELIQTYPLHDVEGEMRKAKIWCRQIGASRRKTAKGMQRFLNGWVGRSEATGHVTKDPERSPSEMIYDRNLKEKIEFWSNLIHDWPVEKLRSNKSFMSAYKTYPEFREWVQKELPNRTKPDSPPSVEQPKVKVSDRKCNKVPVTADIPPPEPEILPPEDPEKAALVEEFMKRHDLF